MYVVPLQLNYERAFSIKYPSAATGIRPLLRRRSTTSTPTPAIARARSCSASDDGYEQAVIVTISSGLSGPCELMRSITVRMPELDCCIVDTKNISMGAGLVALAVARRLVDGATSTTCDATAKRIVESTKVFFCVDTLEYLHKGGRIGNCDVRGGAVCWTCAR